SSEGTSVRRCGSTAPPGRATYARPTCSFRDRESPSVEVTMNETRGMPPRELDVVVIGGGQAGLATAFYLRRTGLSWVVLDAQDRPGGAWLHTWESLRLFSPARFSSLPGWVMEGGPDYYPTRDEAIDYLERYEERYGLHVDRPTRVTAVTRAGDRLRVRTDRADWLASAVVSATGSRERPYMPPYPGGGDFRGVQRHAARYRSPSPFLGQRVLVIGGGNSGAQMLAEVSRVSDASWVTLTEPTFLPDHRAEERRVGEDGGAGVSGGECTKEAKHRSGETET